MATSVIHGNTSPLLVVSETGGVTVIDSSTPLKRLNYFDGKLLRADDFKVEQNYLRELVALSNQGLGPGVVYGYDTTLGKGDTVQIGPGLAIDPSGKVLLMQSSATHGIQALIEASRRTVETAPDASGKTSGFGDCVEIAAPPPGGTVVAPAGNLYVIAICAAEALCGTQDVYGKLCEEACVTSTDRPYRLDGVVVRAIPLQLVTPFPVSKAVAIDANLYLRSKVAHSWYRDEERKHPHAISRDGLLSHVWCLGAGYNTSCCEVPLAVVARAGSTTVFLDAWIIRRERMEAPSRRYWQWKMMMRPWDVYLAQVLQFQCHLADMLAGIPVPGDGDENPCAPQHRALNEAAQFVEEVRSGLVSYRKVGSRATLTDRPALLSMSLANVTDLRDRIQRVLQATPARPTDRILINGGIIETPSAGYLPVMTGASVTVNQQVRALLGDGVDLRFCVVRPDFVAHAFEEAQHMERISLIEGLENPRAKPAVDVLVPDGQVAAAATATGTFYEMRLNVLPQNLVLLAAAFAAKQADPAGASRRVANFDRSMVASLVRVSQTLETFEYTGAAHGEQTPAGNIAFHYAGTTGLFTLGADRGNTTGTATGVTTGPATGTVTGATPGAATGVASGVAADVFATGASFSGSTRINPERMTGFRAMAAAPAARQAPQIRSSLWTTMDVAADPATRARGDVLRVTFEEMVLLTAETRVKASTEPVPTDMILLRANFTGELQVEKNEARPGTEDIREITGVLTGELALSYRQRGASDTESDSMSLYLSENIRILRTMGPLGAAFRIEMPKPALFQPFVVELEARREWKSATRAEAAGTMTLIMGGDATTGLSTSAAKQVTRQAFTAWQTINPAVREPNHAAHESAIRALRSIGTALGAGKFADLAARRLFPAPPPRGSDLSIHATHDWVLFHRRRDKLCKLDEPGLRVETRQYALYQVALTGRQTVAEIARLLQRAGPRGEGLPELDFVQLVEFDAGIHAVATPHAQVQASWRQDVGVGVTIEGGVIASRGVALAEGERLARERLEAVVEVVGAVAPVDPHPDYAVLTRVPDALDVPSNDGIIVMATREVALRSARLIYGNWDRVAGGVGQHFLEPGAKSSLVQFSDNAPQGTALTNFIGTLTVDEPVLGVTLATTKANPDPGAQARLNAVISALVAAGRPEPVATRKVVEAINEHDRKQVEGIGHDPNAVDEVIFFERNSGA
jgi:hypothetical protein